MIHRRQRNHRIHVEQPTHGCSCPVLLMVKPPASRSQCRPFVTLSVRTYTYTNTLSHTHIYTETNTLSAYSRYTSYCMYTYRKTGHIHPRHRHNSCQHNKSPSCVRPLKSPPYVYALPRQPLSNLPQNPQGKNLRARADATRYLRSVLQRLRSASPSGGASPP